MHDYNYGRIKVDTLENSVFVEIKNLKGKSHFGRKFDLNKDLQFDPKKLKKNRELCIAV